MSDCITRFGGKAMLSVIVPAYNEQAVVKRFAQRAGAVLEDNGIDYEIVFVDDGSSDGTWREIESLSAENGRVRGVSFSRNFGKEAALMAGLANAGGSCCVTIDCDLQHPPETIPEMYRLWEQGYEVIEGVKRSRGRESGAHRALAGIFYKLMGGGIGESMDGASDFKLLDRKVVDVLLSFGERNTFYRALSKYVGYKTASVYFDVAERAGGETKWSFSGLFKYAVSNLTAFSVAPMRLVTVLGCIMLAFSALLGGVALYQKFAGYALEGFTTVIIIQLFVGSIIVISLGIMGHYIARIYEEIKGRPRYIISKRCGKDTDD